MSLQIYIADDWPEVPSAVLTPTEVSEVTDDPRTLLYLVDDHLAAVAQAQARAETEARRKAAQRALVEAALQEAVEQARELAEQETRARALAEWEAENGLAQLIISLAQEEVVHDALGRRALHLNALPAEPVFGSIFPRLLHPDSYAFAHSADLDHPRTYGSAINALLENKARQRAVFQNSPYAIPDAENTRNVRQAAPTQSYRHRGYQGPSHSEYADIPIRDLRGSARSHIQPTQDAYYRQAWPGLLSFLQDRAEAEADAPPPAPEAQPKSASDSPALPSLKYLAFPGDDAFYAPLQSAAATRDANDSLFLAPSSDGTSVQDYDGPAQEEEDVEMASPGVWQPLTSLRVPQQHVPARLVPRTLLPRHFAQDDVSAPSATPGQSRATNSVGSPSDDEEASLNWLAEEILRSRLSKSDAKDGARPSASEVVILDDGTVGDNSYDAQAGQNPALTRPGSATGPTAHPATTSEHDKTIPVPKAEARLARDVANEFGAGLPVEIPVAIEEPAPSSPASTPAESASLHSRTPSRARATTVMDEADEDELEGRVSSQQPRKVART